MSRLGGVLVLAAVVAFAYDVVKNSARDDDSSNAIAGVDVVHAGGRLAA